ncbi:hypothetical protein GWG65_06325 [Bradyrhizobium sp. CSA207]|uniref:hypothetical protein n=1 Tax=Bradyrhizobium sp. CSA207 TaxID=2698826 RepID=UPI0023B1632E|nr:hypothetical protein [Bradyrhizobium sp. CSA207]MDE5441077.1 hypothetical protein [Bradyrhizobium sp. CSA207]
MRYSPRLQAAALTASALVPCSFSFAQADIPLERVAQDPHDDLRGANEAYLRQVAANCTGNVQDEASKLCPQSCMIAVPNTSLPAGDSCDPRTWRCAWPQQAVGETQACPSGWTGTYSQDHYFDVQSCGTTMGDTGQVKLLSVNCSRDRPEGRTDACPNVAGGGWVGGGATYSRTHHEVLVAPLGTTVSASSIPWTVSETSVTDWSLVGNVNCTRDIKRDTYDSCLSGASCYKDTVSSNGAIMANTCGMPASPKKSSSMVGHQHLASDLTTVVTDSYDAATQTLNECVCPDGSAMPADGQCTKPCPDGGTRPYNGYCRPDLCWGQRFSGDIAYYGCLECTNLYPSWQVIESGGGYCGNDGTDGDGGGGSSGGEGDAGGDDSPVTIDMDNDGFNVISKDASTATFDFTPGKRVKTAWVSPKDPLLAMDYNGNGTIDGSLEVFGNVDTTNGFEALRVAEDTNHDNVIDAKDKNWKKLVAWFDLNGDGVGQPNELKSLDSLGVAAIPLTYSDSTEHTKDAFFPFTAKVLMKDGSTRPASDIFLLDSAVKALYGTAGNDVLVYKKQFLLVDGQDGSDTLRVEGADNLILGGTEFLLRNVEVIDLKNKIANHVDIDMVRLLENSRSRLDLTIEGDKADSVTVKNAAAFTKTKVAGYTVLTDKVGNRLRIGRAIQLK